MKKNNDLLFVNLSQNNYPKGTESKNLSDDNYVTWGTDCNNLYPNFLLKLYNESPTHSAIINQKATYIIGAGLQIDGRDIDIKVNPIDTLKEFVSKITLDYLIFGSFSAEVVLGKTGQPTQFYHTPMQKIRINKSLTKFWFADDWSYKRNMVIYDRYSPTENSDNVNKIFYYDSYKPSDKSDVYVKPDYEATITAILTDIAINKLNYNNVTNGFSPSSVITFYNGNNVSEEDAAESREYIDQMFRGENGAKYIVDFKMNGETPTDVKQLSANNWSKEFIETAKNNVDTLITGNGCQSSSLFGIKTAGQLGSTQELEIAYGLFKSNYCEGKRQQLESALNQLFINFPLLQGQLKFVDKPPVTTQMDDATLQKILTVNEMRLKAGYPKHSDDNIGNKLVSQLESKNQPADNTAPVIDTPVQPEDVKKKSSGKSLNAADFELVKHLGLSADNFEEIEPLTDYQQYRFDRQGDIAKWLIKNDIKGLTVDELVNVLKNEGGISASKGEVLDTMDELTKSGVANIETDKNGRIKITPSNIGNVPDTDKISVMYKYIKKPTVDGNDLVAGSRPFCVKLIENAKLYSRSDIQEMSSIFGYDVFRFSGGWYTNSETNEATPSCRHTWQPLKVKPKKK